MQPKAKVRQRGSIVADLGPQKEKADNDEKKADKDEKKAMRDAARDERKKAKKVRMGKKATRIVRAEMGLADLDAAKRKKQRRFGINANIRIWTILSN